MPEMWPITTEIWSNTVDAIQNAILAHYSQKQHHLLVCLGFLTFVFSFGNLHFLIKSSLNKDFKIYYMVLEFCTIFL